MTVLKVWGPTSFKKWAARSQAPVYSVYDQGELITRKRAASEHRISFDVSTKEWDDASGQIADSIVFLTLHAEELKVEFAAHEVSSACLDIPIWSRLDERIGNQNQHLPVELIVLAGRLGVAIEVSLYAQDAFSGLEEDADKS